MVGRPPRIALFPYTTLSRSRRRACARRPGPARSSAPRGGRGRPAASRIDRKSTRLNSSHVKTSYAVFCLKKKNIYRRLQRHRYPQTGRVRRHYGAFYLHVHRRQVAEVFFFFNDTATTEIYTLSLHDALPILPAASRCSTRPGVSPLRVSVILRLAPPARSEEHTSELQSRENLVCRLLLEKKKKNMKKKTTVKKKNTPPTQK